MAAHDDDRTTWPIAVKVEDLKAAVRTYVRINDLRNILQNLTPTLPNELIDMILTYAFDDLYDKFSRQWTAIYACSATTDDPKVLGTVYRRLCERVSRSGLSWDHIIFDYCADCISLAENAREELLEGDVGLLDEEWHEQAMDEYFDGRWPRCNGCLAILNEKYQFITSEVFDKHWGSEWRDHHDYEDTIVNADNACDNHPDATRIFTDLKNNGFGGSWEYWADDGFQEAQEGLAMEWHSAFDNDCLFTQKEIAVLASFGVQVKLGQVEDGTIFQHTAAVLIPLNFTGSSKRDEASDNGDHDQPKPASIAPPTEDHSLTHVLKKLRLKASRVSRDRLEGITSMKLQQARQHPQEEDNNGDENSSDDNEYIDDGDESEYSPDSDSSESQSSTQS